MSEEMDFEDKIDLLTEDGYAALALSTWTTLQDGLYSFENDASENQYQRGYVDAIKALHREFQSTVDSVIEDFGIKCPCEIDHSIK